MHVMKGKNNRYSDRRPTRISIMHCLRDSLPRHDWDCGANTLGRRCCQRDHNAEKTSPMWKYLNDLKDCREQRLRPHSTISEYGVTRASYWNEKSANDIGSERERCAEQMCFLIGTFVASGAHAIYCASRRWLKSSRLEEHGKLNEEIETTHAQ